MLIKALDLYVNKNTILIIPHEFPFLADSL